MAYVGMTLLRFAQLKTNKRFDDFIMLVWKQGLIFILYRGQIQKLPSSIYVSKAIATDSPCYKDSEKV